MEARRFRRPSSGEQAARYIRELIFEGRLAPGSRVPQDDLARELGMSRIPVREALIALERQGWVRIEPHRGAFVTPLDPATVRDHYELYALILGFAAHRALERSGPWLLERLGEITRRLGTLLEDPAAFGEATFDFHRAVVTGARSPRIAVALRAMTSLVPGEFFALVPGSIDVERKGTTAILRALRRSDTDAAAEAYGRMMRQIGDLVVEVFEDRNLFGPGSDLPLEGSATR